MNRAQRKQRTRQHVIADLSANHVERVALTCGYSVERVAYDYGYDLLLWTYDRHGNIENGAVHLQLKASDSFRLLSDGRTISFPLRREDLDLWLSEPMPVVLVLYDAQMDKAYWVYVQSYFNSLKGFSVSPVMANRVVHVNTANVLDQQAMRRFAGFRDNVLSQLSGVIQHHG